MTYSNDEKKTLLQIARDAISFGLKNNIEMKINTSDYSKNLQQDRASFVTLHLNHQLRGCIGSLQAYQPLIQDVAHNAYAAAFLDPRFLPLTSTEFSKLSYHISVLNAPEPMTFISEEDLIRQLRPGIDGLILTDGFHKGTFLPSVWEELPDPSLFMKHLKQKAGLSPNYWSDSIKIERYTAESIGDDNK